MMVSIRTVEYILMSRLSLHEAEQAVKAIRAAAEAGVTFPGPGSDTSSPYHYPDPDDITLADLRAPTLPCISPTLPSER